MNDETDPQTRSLAPHPDAVDVEIDEIDETSGIEEAEGEDPLADVIADLESRLEMIRETHVEQEMLEVDVLTREGDLVVYRDDIAERERSLGDTEIELRDREMRIEQERSEFLRQRQRIAERLHELEDLETALVEQVEDQASENEDLGRERASIETKRELLKDEQETLSMRESEVSSKADELAAERDQVSTAQDELTKDKRVLEEQATEQQKLAGQLEEMRGDLADREKELESRLAEHDELKDMVHNMSGQLDESRAEAKAQAEQYEKALTERADDEKRNEDLERRCRTLETERARIRGELTKARQETNAGEARPGLVPARTQQLQLKTCKAHSRSAELGGMIWFVSMGIGAIGLAISMGEGTIATGIGALGAATALCIFACHVLVGRTWDVSMLLIVAFAGAFVLWFPHWFETISTAASLWEVPAEVLPPAFADRIPMAFAAGTAALALAVSIYLITRASSVLGHAIFAAAIATGVLMIPSQSIRLQALAAILWLAIVSATLVKWSMNSNKAASRVTG